MSALRYLGATTVVIICLTVIGISVGMLMTGNTWRNPYLDNAQIQPTDPPGRCPKPQWTRLEEEIFRLGAIVGATLERREPGKYHDAYQLSDAAWQHWQQMTITNNP